MESTGVCWIKVYEILEKRGFEVILVNARHAKNVPGAQNRSQRCRLVTQLHFYGLLRAPRSQPCEPICASSSGSWSMLAPISNICRRR